MQNRTHAVMAQRWEPKGSLDDFPTPPWATRALFEHVIPGPDFSKLSCLEPACGLGYMVKVLSEYFGSVRCSDCHDYGRGDVLDYIRDPYPPLTYDWVITNPPFQLAEQFILKSLDVARTGVAIIARTVFIESIGRFERLFRDRPPVLFAQFSERVPILRGRLDRNASTATGYCWLVWNRVSSGHTRLVWIPPCRNRLEKSADYDPCPTPATKRYHEPGCKYAAEPKADGGVPPGGQVAP